MPLRVGSIYSEYLLDIQGLRDGVSGAVLQFKELQQAARSTRSSLQKTNDGIIADFKRLQSELAALKPFEPLITSGAKAYNALVGHSIIPDLTKQTLTLLSKMRGDIDRLNAFDPMTVDAARAASQTLKTIETLEQQLEAKKIEVGAIGVKKEDLRAIVDEAGQVRDEVLQRLRSGQSRKQRPGDPGFGQFKDAVEQTKRIENIVAKAGAGTELRKLGDDMNEFGQGTAAALQRASDLYAEINLLEQEIRQLSEAAAGGGNAIGQMLVEADEAAQGAEDGMRRLADAQKAVAESGGNIARLTRQMELYTRAGSGAAISEERRALAWEKAEQKQRELEQAERRHERLLQSETYATEEQELAIQRLIDAQKALDALLTEAEQARRGPTPEQAPAGQGKLFADERKRQEREAEKAADHQRKLDADSARLKQQAEIDAARAAAEFRYRLEIQEKNNAIQRELELERARIQAEAEIAKVRLQEEAKVERQREREEARRARVTRVARGGAGTLSGLGDEEKAIIERARAEKQFADAIAVVDTRLNDETLTLAQQNRLLAQRKRLLEEERVEQQRQERESARIMRKLLPIQRVQKATGLGDEERSIVRRARAQADFAAAVNVVDARLKDTTITLTQQNNLLALRQTLLQDELDYRQRINRENAKLIALVTPKTVRPTATGLTDEERSIVRRARAEKEYGLAIDVIDAKLKSQTATLSQQNNLLAQRRKIIDLALRQQAESERKADKAGKLLSNQLKQTVGATGLTDVQQSMISLARSEKDFAAAIRVVDEALDAENLTLTEQNNLLAQRKRLLNEQDTADAKLAKQAKENTGVLGLLSSSFRNLAGALGLATFGYEVISRTLRAVKDSFVMTAEIDENRRTLGQMIANQDRANRALQQGIDFGRKFGFTQREIAEAARLLAPQMRNSTVELSKQFEILARLSSRAPEQGISGAAYALGELSAGDVQSIADRFNIPRRIANQMKQEILAGGDVFTVLDKTLTRLGLTAEVLGERMQGASGAIRDVAVAGDELKSSLGEILGGPASSFLHWLADVEHQAALTLDGLRGLTIERARLAAGTPIAPPNELQKINQESLVAADARKGGVTAFSLIFRPLETIPQLLRALGSQGQQNLDRIGQAAAKVSPQMERMGDAISVATNRFNEGRSTLAAYAQDLRAIGQQNRITPLMPDTNLDTIPELTAQLEAWQAKAREDSGFARAELPRAIGLAQELARLKALSPIELTAEMRTDQLNAAAQALDAIRGKIEETGDALKDLDKAEQERNDSQFLQDSQAWSDHLRGLARLKSDFDKQQLRSNSDFDRQQEQSRDAFRHSTQRGDRDFNAQLEGQRIERERGMARELRDFNAQLEGQRLERERGMAREERDLARSRQREERDNARNDQQSEQEHLDAREEMRQQSAEQIVKIEDDARKRLLKLQGDYQVDATRAQEDYELDRMVLIAEGRIAEARVLESRFTKERRRAAEDQARAGSEIVDDVDTSRQEERDSLAEQLADEQAAYEKARQETRRQRQQAREDAEADRRIALEDARIDYERGRQQAIDDRSLALDDARQDYERGRQQAIDERNKQKIDAQADFDAMIEANKAQHDQQTADAQAAYDQQEQDLKESYRRQKDRQEYEQQQERQRTADQRTALLTNLQEYIDDEKAKLEGNYNDIKRLEELKATVIDENEAKAVLALENSLKEINRLVDAQQPAMYDSGVKNGLAWIEGWAAGLQKGASSGAGGAPAAAGGVIGNANTADDPRPTQAAITAIFGPLARVTSTYDANRPGTTGVHRGLDVTMIPGSRVPAPLALLVRKVSPDQYGGGTTVLAIDTQGRQWLFAHMYNVPVKAGQPLAKGATMGYIGAEGHVHVQLRRADDASVPIDPSAALDEAAAADAATTPGAWLGGNTAQPGGSSGFGAQSTRRSSLTQQGYSDGRAYKTGLVNGLQSRSLPEEMLSLGTRSLPQPGTTTGAGGGAPVVVQIRLQADVVMDGQKVGTLVAPTVEQHLANDLTIQASVVESNYTPGVYQSAFRRPI